MLEDIRRAKEFFTLFMLGLTIAAIGLSMALVMPVFFVNANTTLSLWVCFGIVGGITFLIGAVFLAWADTRNHVNFIPERTAEAVKESIEWISSLIKTSKRGKKLERI